MPKNRHQSPYARQGRATSLRDWLERVDERFMGAPIDCDPLEALRHCIAVTAGEVAYCDQQISRLHSDELFERPLTSVMAELPSGKRMLVEERRDAEVISRWVSFRNSALDRLARYSKMALDANIEERQTRIAENEAQRITRYFERVLEDVDLTPAQVKRLGPAMRKHLELVS